MTNEDMKRVIALLDDARKICAMSQVGFADSKCRTEELIASESDPDTSGVARIYWAGCRGLANLARKLASIRGGGSPVALVSKIGLTEENIAKRLLILGLDKYGSVHREAGRETARPGFERWIAQAIHVPRAPRDAAISVTARTIDVALPPGMTRRQMDLGLRKALAPYSLDGHGIECFTRYSGLERQSRATELVIGPDPRDAEFLLEIVEKILADHRTRNKPRGSLAAIPPRARLFKARYAKAASHRTTSEIEGSA